MTERNRLTGDEPINQHAPGAKLDHDKVDMSLLEFLHNALFEVCRVMDYGQTKYSRGGFLEVDNAVPRYTAAMWRHWLDECAGIMYDEGDPFYDTEKGARFKYKLRHDAQLAVNALFRLECKLREEQEQVMLDFEDEYAGGRLISDDDLPVGEWIVREEDYAKNR